MENGSTFFGAKLSLFGLIVPILLIFNNFQNRAQR